MNPTDTQESLLKAAQDYTHVPTSQATLDPYKEAILTLRAKYASYEIVTEMLTQHGVQISLATVRRFCRRHHADMKRIRNELLAQKKAAAQNHGPDSVDLVPGSNHVPKDLPSPVRSPRSLRGPV